MQFIAFSLLFHLISIAKTDWQSKYEKKSAPDILFNGIQIDIQLSPYNAVVFADKSFPKLEFCGAAIITTRHLISAAYFFALQQHKNFKVITGSTFVKSYENYNFSEQSNYHSIKKIYIHEKYDPSEIYHNIALIELTSLLRFSYKIHYIPLMNLQDVYNITENEFTMTITGYGREENQWISHLTEQTIQINDIRIHKLNERLLVLDRKEAKFCFGDSGSPGVINGKLAAVMMHDDFCNFTDLPLLLTGIPYYYEWIKTYVGQERLEKYPHLN
ncbi:trypsin epsilon-like [Leptopilina boulardi]|uniref:trypsin epsilon-like n=1 Tax=Leptopilina boulardi TaxID=63433 RepID=UPI0021F603A1|nr:trypsin epsilon-like [Leptopilina boulardi]